MGIVFRQSAKNIIVIVVGAMLGAFILWLSAHYIPDKHRLGFTVQFTVIAVSLSQLLLMGLSSTLAVYIHRYLEDEHKRKVLITLCLLIPVLLLAIASVFFVLFRANIFNWFQPEDIPMVKRYFGWIPLYTLFFIFQLLLEQYLASQMKVAIAAFIREIVVRFINIALLLLFAFGYISFDYFIAGLVLMYLVPVCAFFFLSSKTKVFGLSLSLSSFSKDEYTELAKFSWYHFLLSASILFMGYMDNLLLLHYDHNGFGDAAIYRYAVFLIVVLQMPSKALIPASLTVLARAFNEKDMVKAKDLFSRSSLNILIPTLCLAVMLFCNLNNIVAILKNNYAGIIPIFSILFIGSLVNMATGMNDQVLSIANYYKFNFYLSISLTVILFALLKFLIPRYGVYGAAWSSTTILMIFNIAKYIFIKRKLDMQPFSPRTLLVILAALPAAAAGYFFPYLFEPSRHVYVHSFIDAILRSGVIVIVYLAMLIWLKPSPDLQEYLASIRKNKRLF
jgi:O-antigen/teichoic acid export membrane protein